MKLLRVVGFVGLFLFSASICFSQDKLKVVIFSLSNISYQDIEDANLPSFNYLLQNGALGLMNTRCARGLNLGSSYLTMGASARAYAGKESGEGFNAAGVYHNTKVSDIYQRRTGRLSEKDEVVQINFEKIKKGNSTLDYFILPGALGEAIKERGFSAAVIGNSDTDEFHREIVALIADNNGRVKYGEVSKDILAKDINYPFGVKCDIEKMFNNFLQFKKKADVVVMEFGDVYRWEKYRDFFTKDIEKIQKKKILQNADILLGYILKNIGNASFLLICPLPSAKKDNGLSTTLTPVIILSKKIKPGLLTSATTRQKGVVANLDVAPTVLNLLNITAPDFMYGERMRSQRENHPIKKIRDLEGRLSLLEGQNVSFLEFLIFFWAGSIILSFLAFLGKNKIAIRASSYALLFASALPFAMLIQGTLPPKETLLAGIFTLLGIAVVLVLSLRIILHRSEVVFLSLCGITFFAISLDVFLGSNLQKFSPLGFSLAAGARFYGVGNEYVSVLIFSCALFVGMSFDLFSKYKTLLKIMTIFIMVFVLYIIMSPTKGANTGGGITAIFTFAFLCFFIVQKKINLKLFLSIFLLVGVFLSAFILQDIKRGKDRSHLGKFVGQIQNQGAEVVVDTVKRKAKMNIKLIQYTRWNKVLVPGLIVIVLLIYYPIKVLRLIKDDYKNLSSTLSAIIIGSGVGLVFNDSGIIMAIIGITTICITLLYIISIRDYIFVEI